MKDFVHDPARLSLLLNQLRLPTIKAIWQKFAERADKEGWPAERFLAAITEHELAERDRRRIQRHLAEARLLPGKTLDNFEFDCVPMISKAQVTAITAGDSWCARHGHWIGGESPLRGELVATVSRRQLHVA